VVDAVVEPDSICHDGLEIQYLLPPPYDEFLLKVDFKAPEVQGLKCVGVPGELGYQLLELLSV